MEGSALFITSWKRNSYGPANWKMITDFCENTLKKKPVEFSKIHCTVLDIDVGDKEKEDAARHSVTLIPATRPKLSDPVEDPPAINWLRFPDSYYPGLEKLENINHVVAMSSNVKKTAAALQKSVFPGAKFHPPPDKPSAAVFINEAWNKDALGLTGFHRTLVQDFCKRKAKGGETLKAYSTVLDVKISDDQKIDAENCGVTLIPAQRKEKADHRDDPPKLEWLLNHEIYYPDLREVENVQYVIGYAPKTGRAAADIRRNIFPDAKLVLINHACPETNCLPAEEHGLWEFEEKMLQMASEADILFSMGPRIYDYFENAYRAEVQGRDVSDIPHQEILPWPDTCFRMKEPKKKPVTRHHILTYGQMDRQNAIERCKSIATSIGTVANRRKANYSSHPEWKIQGVSENVGKTEQKILADALGSPYVYPKLQPGHSTKSLLTSLQQSHLCLPSPFYWDYSFYGMEAMIFGLPTTVNEDSHLAHFLMKHLEMCVEDCVIRISDMQRNLSEKISYHLEKTPVAFKKAKAVKTALIDCEAFTESFAKFASLLKEPIKQEYEDDSSKGQEVAKCDDIKPSSYIGKSSTQSTNGVPEPENGNMSTQAVTKDDGIGIQVVKETHGDVMDKDDTESGQATTTPSEMENEKTDTEEAKDGNYNEEQQELPVKVALDEEMLQKRLRQLEEQTKALSVQLRRLQGIKKNKVKAAWRECENGLKRIVPAVLADEDNCSEVKKVCKEKVGLDPTTVTAESLGMLLKILTLYHLYRLKQTCRSRNLAKALEPLLITKEMREIAAKVGITLQLKATYNTVKFEEIERFFLNRDGGGVQPLTFHDEIEDDDYCNIDAMDEEPPLSQQACDQVVVTASDQTVATAIDQVAEQISQTSLKQDFEEKLVAQHGELTQPITAAQESQARSLLPIKPSEQQLMSDSYIRYLALAESKVQSLHNHLDKSESKVQSLQSHLDKSESKVQSLQSQLQKAFTEKQILETQLAEALQEKSQLEKQCQVYKQRYHSAENIALTAKLKKVDPKNIEDLQTQLKEQNTVITELKAKLSKLSDAQSDIEPQMKTEESLQLGEQIITSEIVHKEVTEPSADNVYIKPKITEIEEGERPKLEMTARDSADSEMETATPRQPEMTVRDGSEMETATPTQPEMTVREGSEIETATPTQPEMIGRDGSEIETATPTQPEMTVRDRSEIETATPTQPETTGRAGRQMKTATPTQPEMTVREGSEMETATSTQTEMAAREGWQGETAMVTTATKLQKEKEESGGIVSRIVKLLSGGSDETGSSAVMSRSKKQQHGTGTAGSEESPSGPMSSEKKSSGQVSSEKKSSGHVSSEKKSSGPVSSEKKSSGPVSSEKKSSGQVSSEKKSSGQVSSEKKSSGPVSFEKKSSGPVSSEKKSSGPVSSGSKMEHRSSVTAGSGSKELSSGPASSVVSGGMVIPGGKEGQSGTDGDSGEETSDSKSKKAIFGGPAKRVAGQWSKRTLKGHQGQMFKSVRGLAFHNDKLLVCDSDNNIVHILNQDYTCEKELGSFSGQYTKPFTPWSIAVSQDNLYFILDRSNLQIVVCDQNNKVIRIINLPAGSNPSCIALVKGFVIVTEVNGQRVLKYSLDGMYIGELGVQGDGHTEFNLPGFVAVNSKDVIMVSDSNNHCIKCFDTQFNYLYKYGQFGHGNAQLHLPGSIAVDGADNVYVCDRNNDRISIWSEDTTWLCNLFHYELRWPVYMAVTADGDRIAVVSGWYQSRDEIVVFSK